MASKPVTAAAKNLGITASVAQASESVKSSLVVLSDVVDIIRADATKPLAQRTITANSIDGELIASRILARGSVSESAYRVDGNHTLRVSSHSAKASNFVTSGENLSLVLLQTNKTNEFVSTDNNNVIEATFKKSYLNNNPEAFVNFVKDMARFIVTGEYMDTAGAKSINISGTEEFKNEVRQRLEKQGNDDIRFSDKDSAPNATRATSDTAQQTVRNDTRGAFCAK